MVEQETSFDKEKLKNKRSLKGTPLYRYATRYSRNFALTLGAAHLSILGITYFYIETSREFFTQGVKQISEGAYKLGMWDKHENDTEMRLQWAKEELRHSPVHSTYLNILAYIEGVKTRQFSKQPAEETNPPVTEKTQSPTVSQVPEEANK